MGKKISIGRRIYSTLLIILGIAGIFVTLSSMMPMNPIMGMMGFIISICVLIIGLDESDAHKHGVDS